MRRCHGRERYYISISPPNTSSQNYLFLHWTSKNKAQLLENIVFTRQINNKLIVITSTCRRSTFFCSWESFILSKNYFFHFSVVGERDDRMFREASFYTRHSSPLSHKCSHRVFTFQRLFATGQNWTERLTKSEKFFTGLHWKENCVNLG